MPEHVCVRMCLSVHVCVSVPERVCVGVPEHVCLCARHSLQARVISLRVSWGVLRSRADLY